MSELTERERLRKLVFLASQLVGVHTMTHREVNSVTYNALNELRDDIQHVVWHLEDGVPYRPLANHGLALWNVRFAYITHNQKPDRDRYCGSVGSSTQRPCRNRPLVGIEHCGTHASETDKARQKAMVARWEEHRDATMRRYEVDKVIAVLTSVLSKKESTSS